MQMLAYQPVDLFVPEPNQFHFDLDITRINRTELMDGRNECICEMIIIGIMMAPFILLSKLTIEQVENTPNSRHMHAQACGNY